MALGIAAAWKARTPVDYIALLGSLMAWSLPTFWLGIILLFWGSTQYGLPTGGKITPGGNFATVWQEWGDLARHMILPTLPTPSSSSANICSSCGVPCWMSFPKITSSPPKPKG
ncbi:MAG: hypothetical protein IPL78_17825 [Chloroflexi bacterium]|nr:hypothetical protein [Chloroflexota bacterium]